MERNVAVIVETSNSYARGVLRGIHEYARTRHGWTLYLTEHGRHEFDESFACHWKFDGVIARIETDQMARIITDMDVPTVDVSAARLIQGIPWVETDDEAITRTALDHLRDCGLQNFAFFGDPFYHWSIWRQQSFKRILGRPDIIQSRIFNLPARKEPRVRWWTQRYAIWDWLESLPKPVDFRLLRCIRSATAGDLSALRLQGSRGHRRHRRGQRRASLRARGAQHVERHSQFTQSRRLRGRDSGSHDGRGKAPGAQVLHRTPRRAQTRFNRRPGRQRSSRRQGNRLHPAEGPRAHEGRGSAPGRSAGAEASSRRRTPSPH